MIQESKYNNLKFRIKELLHQLPADDYIAAKKQLPALVGLNRGNFSKLINTKADSNYQPRPNVLIKLASFFKVSVNELYNFPPESISIEDVNIANESHVAKDLSLTA